MELVDPVEVLGLAEQQQVRVPARADQREGPQQMAVGEVLAGSRELALVRGALLGVEPAPGGIHLQERVFHEVPAGHRGFDDRRTRNPVGGAG